MKNLSINLSILYITRLLFVVQKINRSFWVVFLLAHSFYLSSIFGAGIEGVEIKEEREDIYFVKEE